MFGLMHRGGRDKGALLGLDITAEAVRLLELSRSGGRYRVENYGIEPLPEGAVIARDISRSEPVGAAIRRLVGRTGARTGQAAVALAGSAVAIKNLRLPAELSEDDMEIRLQAEADRHLPFPLEDLAMDFARLPPSGEHPEEAEVLLVACPGKQVARQQEALALGGLQAGVVDLEPCCVQRVWRLVGDRKERVVGIVNTGAGLTTLSVLTEAAAPYTRELNLGGGHPAGDLSRRDENGDDGDIDMEAGTAPCGETLVQQIELSLQLFYSSSGHDDVDRLVMAGSNARLDELASLVAVELGTPCSIAAPFAGMAVSPELDRAALLQAAPALTVACGLALRGFS